MNDHQLPAKLYEIRTALDMIASLAELLAIDEQSVTKRGAFESISSLAQLASRSAHEMVGCDRPVPSQALRHPFRFPEERSSALRILIVDDNEVNQKLLNQVLTKMGHSVCVAADGAVGVRTAKHQEFDLILMDIMMPVMNGIAATQLIREYLGDTQRVPQIFALTAFEGSDEDKIEMKKLFDAFLVKPLQLGLLKELVARVSPLSAS